MLLLKIIGIAAVSISLIFALCNLRNYYVRGAIKEDKLSPQIIPESYYRSYYRDWFLLIVVLVAVGVVVGLLLNAI